MPEARSPEVVRREIEAERERLELAVGELRGRLGDAAKIGPRLRVLAPAAFVAGFFASGGVGATMRMLARRSREH